MAFFKFGKRGVGFSQFSHSHFLSGLFSNSSHTIMNSLMNPPGDNFKIFNPIVIFNSIFMMYKLIGSEVSTNILFHNNSVLKIVPVKISARMVGRPLHNISRFIMNKFETLFRGSISGPVSTVTPKRTILSSDYLVWINLKSFVTKQTNFIKHYLKFNIPRRGCQYGYTI